MAKGLSWCRELGEPEIVFISLVKMSPVVSTLSVGVRDGPVGHEAVLIAGLWGSMVLGSSAWWADLPLTGLCKLGLCTGGV